MGSLLGEYTYTNDILSVSSDCSIGRCILEDTKTKMKAITSAVVPPRNPKGKGLAGNRTQATCNCETQSKYRTSRLQGHLYYEQLLARYCPIMEPIHNVVFLNESPLPSLVLPVPE